MVYHLFPPEWYYAFLVLIQRTVEPYTLFLARIHYLIGNEI